MDGGTTLMLKLGALLGASTAGGAVVAEVITGTEHLFLGIPQSWFLAAVVGALIGLLLLRVGLLGLFVLGFAIAAGWIVVALSNYFPSMKPAGMAFSGLSGFVIKPMLPHYLGALQKLTDRMAGRAGGAA